MSQVWPIVFMGTPGIAADTLEYLLTHIADPIAGVVTQPDRPSGRGQQSSPSPVRKLAEARGIPVIAPEKIRTSDFCRNFARLAAGSSHSRGLWAHLAENNSRACTPRLHQRALLATAEISRRRAGGMDDHQWRCRRRCDDHEAGRADGRWRDLPAAGGPAYG